MNLDTDYYTKNQDWYGFISPTGEVFFVDWGCHNGWAYDYCEETFGEEFLSTKYDRTRAADFLIERGWVLFDSPSFDLFTPHFRIEKITKKQISTVLDLYYDCRLSYTSREIDDKIEEFLRVINY